jgi:hypothetical protein
VLASNSEAIDRSARPTIMMKTQIMVRASPDPRIWMRLLALSFALGATFAATHADAAPTFGTSFGSSVTIGDGSRGPLTFELGPGWQLGAARLELPVVLGAFGDVGLPRHADGFLGVRPTLKVFPMDAVYVKVALQVLTPHEQPLHLGVSVGGGAEIRVAPMVALFGELALSPFFTPETAIPVEARAGLTIRF